MRTSISDASRHSSATAARASSSSSPSVGTNEEALAGVGAGEDCRSMEDVEKRMVSISGRAKKGSATASCCSCNFSDNSEATTISFSSRSCRRANVTVVFASRRSSSREISTARHGRGNDIFDWLLMITLLTWFTAYRSSIHRDGKE